MRNKLLFLAFLEGALVMLLETAAPIVVAPVLGHSVIVWSIVLSLSVGALALGYFLGGFLSKKDRTYDFLMRLFSANALIIMIGWVLLHMQNFSEQDLVTGTFSYLILALVLFFPSIFFGASTPVIVQILNSTVSNEKGIAGKVFSISTIGGIISSLVTGYFLIDSLGLSHTLLVGTILCVLLPVFHFLKSKNFPFIAVSGVNLLFAFYFIIANPQILDSDKFKVLHFSEGISGQLLVADFKDEKQNTRILLINRMGQTSYNLESNFSNWTYVNFMTSAASMYPQGSKTLVLGLGGGNVPRQIKHYLGHQVDAVELDNRIIALSEEYFDQLNARVNTYNDDARRFVKTCEDTYNFIVLDIFNGEIMPSHGLSLEAFEDIKTVLKPGGLIAINFNGFVTGKEGIGGRSVIKTLKEAGFKVDAFDASAGQNKESERNMIYFAYLDTPKWAECKVHTNMAGGEYKIGEHLMPISEISKGDAFVITDDRPIMEYINRYAAESWRKQYLSDYTKKFRKEFGLPLVK